MQNKGQNLIHIHPFASKAKKWGTRRKEKGKNNILTSSFPLGNQKKRNGKGGMRKKRKGDSEFDFIGTLNATCCLCLCNVLSLLL